MNYPKMISRLIAVFIISISIVSCNSGAKESAFTKSAREIFFGADFSKTYDDAVVYYQDNGNLVDVKLFDSVSPSTQSTHQFIFQKHPLVKEGLKAGSLYVMKINDTAQYREVLYFQSKEEGEHSFQAIDQKLRKDAKAVSAMDTTNRKTVFYSAGNTTEVVKGIRAELLFNPDDNRSILTLNLVKSQN